MQKEAIVINGNKTGASSLPTIPCIHLTQEKLKYLWGEFYYVEVLSSV